MSSVKNATELIKWISTKIGQIVLWIEDGTRRVEELSPLKEAIQAVIDRRPFRVEFIEPVIVIKKPSVLGTPSKITLPAIDNPVDPKRFFKTGQGLYMWNDFTDRILSVTKEVKSLPAMEISSFSLLKSATYAEIRNELPEGHVWQDTSAFCGHFAGLLEKQKNGEEGILLNNSYANIFYVVGKNSEVFTVRVGWYSGAREWRVDAYTVDGNQWNAGYRAFSATAGA